MIRPPLTAALLGASGLLPALGCLAVVLTGPADWRDTAAAYAATYAALILSFLGGTWFGYASAAEDPLQHRALIVAMGPSLAALAALTLSPTTALPVLAALLVATLPVDRWLARASAAPPWWLTLRVPLSLGLGAVALATGLALR